MPFLRPRVILVSFSDIFQSILESFSSHFMFVFLVILALFLSFSSHFMFVFLVILALFLFHFRAISSHSFILTMSILTMSGAMRAYSFHCPHQCALITAHEVPSGPKGNPPASARTDSCLKTTGWRLGTATSRGGVEDAKAIQKAVGSGIAWEQ